MKTKLFKVYKKNFLVFLVLGLAISACTPGSSNTQPNSNSQSETSDEQITLQVVDARAGNDSLQAIYDEIDRRFEQANPGVTVVRESQTGEEMWNTINLRLTESDVPDVVMVNMGHGTLGPLAKAGLLTKLDDYAAQYEWSKFQPDSFTSMNGRHSSDGVQMGVGDLWAISDTAAPIGLFYNRKNLESLNLEFPSNWSEFTSALSTAKSGGITPLMFGNLDGWPGIHLFQLPLNEVVGVTGVSDFVYGVSQFDSKTEQAADILKLWVDEDYFPAGWEGLSYEDFWSKFVEGEGLFLPQGSWLTGDLAASGNPDIRFAPVPTSAGEIRATASGDFPWAIPSNAKNKDMAAKYITYRLSDEVAQLYLEGGQIPANMPSNWKDFVEVDSLEGDVYSSWDLIVASEGLIPYMDWTTPDFYNVIVAEIQIVMAKGSSVDFRQNLNTSWSAYFEQE